MQQDKQGKIIDVKTPFFDGKLKLIKTNYSGNNRIALKLVSIEDNEPWFTVTVNLPEEPLDDNCVFIKDFSENEGILDCMVKAGVIELTGRLVETGYVVVPEAKLLV
jgi:hypothetical protein